MANKIDIKDLLSAGAHFGHLSRKWNPNMAPYIYMEQNGIHVINLYKTIVKLEEAQGALQKICSSGKKVLFVATKKQAKDVVSEKAKQVGMPYITERWPGGMLTNFITIRKAVRKMQHIDRMKTDGTFDTLSKKEKLQIERERIKLDKNLGSISDMTRIPGAILVVDVVREHIAIREAKKLGIPIFAMIDTNANPADADFPIPSNDDASKSIDLIISYLVESIEEGLKERNANAVAKEEEISEEEEQRRLKEIDENDEATSDQKKNKIHKKTSPKKAPVRKDHNAH